MGFDENWDEYGEYLEKEEFRKASFFKKIFTARGIKAILRWILYLFLISLFGLILFRLFTNAPSPKMTNMLRTPDAIEAFAKDSNMEVFSQKLHHYYTDDGKFTLYDIRFIPETEELQFTIRYNNSTTEQLRSEYNDEEISDTPFVFVLRDNNGNRFTSYYIKKFKATVYQYARVSFKVPNLFVSEYTLDDKDYPSPLDDVGEYIYKGIYETDDSGKMITSIYFESYYENDVDFEKGSFSKEILVYSSSYSLEKYDYGKQLKGGVDNSISYIDVK